MLANISRHDRMWEKPAQANPRRVEGGRLYILSMTISLAAVFIRSFVMVGILRTDCCKNRRHHYRRVADLGIRSRSR